MLVLGVERRFAAALLGLSLLHHVLMYLVFRQDLQDIGAGLAAHGLVPAGQPGHRRDTLARHPDVPDGPRELAGDRLREGDRRGRAGDRDGLTVGARMREATSMSAVCRRWATTSSSPESGDRR